MIRRLARRPATWIVVAVLAVGGAFGLYWFQPWRLFTNSTVNEALPSTEPSAPTGTSKSGNVVLAAGTLISHEHETSGDVRLVRLEDGRVQVVLQGLSTSDGPDLHVWVTDRAVAAGSDGWHVFDDGRYVDLGSLKGNRGNQVYDIPAGTDLNGLTSVSIWCKRFAVSFGAAQLRPV